MLTDYPGLGNGLLSALGLGGLNQSGQAAQLSPELAQGLSSVLGMDMPIKWLAEQGLFTEDAINSMIQMGNGDIILNLSISFSQMDP
ncbi:MAG: hypothetical protein M0C28_15780 [Candidatus Moduliflexus flocculans]|nr:hypothetical protein [Candidatus Moduliflexus flocculans]